MKRWGFKGQPATHGNIFDFYIIRNLFHFQIVPYKIAKKILNLIIVKYKMEQFETVTINTTFIFVLRSNKNPSTSR